MSFIHQDVSNLGPERAVSLLNTEMLKAEDECDVATSHFCQEEDGAKRSDVNNCDGTNTLQRWLFFYLSCQDVKKTQFPVLCTINFISDCRNHWSVRGNCIPRKRVVSRLCIFPLFFHVRQDMNYEQFSQVPFDPTLMRDPLINHLDCLLYLSSFVWASLLCLTLLFI